MRQNHQNQPKKDFERANLNDRKGASILLEKLDQIRERFPRLSTIWVDGGYSGKAFVMAILHTFYFYWCLQVVVSPSGQKGFVVQQKRWTASIALVQSCVVCD